MAWHITYHHKAIGDMKKLGKTESLRVEKAIDKVAQNPLPHQEGGYGKPLGNTATSKLAGCMKIKLKNLGLRVVYQLIREAEAMKIVIISVRADDAVYKEAERRLGGGE